MGHDQEPDDRRVATFDSEEEFDREDSTLPVLRSVVPGTERLGEGVPRLQLLGIGPGPTTIHLRQEQVVLGRSATTDVPVDSASLSRAHARFERRGPDVLVTDLDSRNGIFLNGLRVHSAVLRDRDTLQLGDLVYRFRSGS